MNLIYKIKNIKYFKFIFIYESTAAALAYGLGISSKKAVKQQENEKLTNFGKSTYDVAPSANDEFKSQENIIVFDLGGGTFD